jgi:4-hydroxyisophthalate hydroxylase
VFASTARDFIEKSIFTDRDFLAAFDPSKDAAAFEAAWDARRKRAVGEVHSFAPNYAGSPIVAGQPGGVTSARGEHSARARAGHHLTPSVLADGRNVYERLGRGFTLLAFGAADSANHWSRMAAELRIPLSVVHDPGEAAKAAYEAELVLVRPDQHVAWAGAAAEAEAERILPTAAGH